MKVANQFFRSRRFLLAAGLAAAVALAGGWMLRLYLAHPEIRVTQMAHLRPCDSDAKLLAWLYITRNKIIFSHHWDQVKADLLRLNPGLDKAVLGADVDYRGYWILIDGKVTVRDLSPFDRIGLPGLIWLEEGVHFDPARPLADSAKRKYQISYYSDTAKRKELKSQYFEASMQIWREWGVDTRLL